MNLKSIMLQKKIINKGEFEGTITKSKMNRAKNVDEKMRIHEIIIQNQLMYFLPFDCRFKEMEKLTKDIQKNEMKLLKLKKGSYSKLNPLAVNA